MSVHQSKGLEWPVVVLPDLGRRFNLQDIKQRVIADRELGVGLRVADAARGIHYPTARYLLIRARKKREQLAEELRLLYVAFTRARERLLLVGSGDLETLRMGLTTPDPQHHIATHALLSGRDPLAWLVRALGRLPGDHFSITETSEGKGPEPGTLCTATFHATPPNPERKKKEDAIVSPCDPESDPLVARQARLLTFRYPHLADTRTRAVFRVTELKPGAGRLEDDVESRFQVSRPLTDYVPDFVTADRTPESAAETGKRRGTLVHRFLQYMDLGAADPETAFGDLVARGSLQEAERGALDFGALRWFWETELGKAMRARPERVRREVPFLARLGDVSSPVLVRGVVDGVILEDDSFTLFDFKTDRVTEAGFNDRIAHYRPQLLAYSWALRETWELPAAAGFLVFLTPRVLVPVPEVTGDLEELERHLRALLQRAPSD
jgi:ATP-dependent helicase/nuclease subunit A